jgi:hypothetical protein
LNSALTPVDALRARARGRWSADAPFAANMASASDDEA